MEHTGNKVLSLAQLSEDGQITIPAEYRRALTLAGHSSLVLVQVGDALVLAPYDEPFTAATSRLEAQMHSAGVTINDLIDAATEARAQIVREEFGAEDEK
jgi:bifunctional DNA-binding transcriptional regulator/antitoxin component of YhaV-PrlF toxin-antitoxin module